MKEIDLQASALRRELEGRRLLAETTARVHTDAGARERAIGREQAYRTAIESIDRLSGGGRS